MHNATRLAIFVNKFLVLVIWDAGGSFCLIVKLEVVVELHAIGVEVDIDIPEALLELV